MTRTTRTAGAACEWLLHGLMFLALTVVSYELRTQILGDVLHLGDVYSFGTLTPWFVLIATISTLTFHLVGPYRTVTAWTPPGGVVLRSLGSLAVVLVVSATAASFMAKNALPRTVILLTAAMAAPAFVVERSITMRVAGALRARGIATRRYLLVGAGPLAADVVEAVESHPERGVRIAGYVDDNAPKAPFTSRCELVCGIDQLATAIERTDAEGVILAAGHDAAVQFGPLELACAKRGLELVVAVDHDQLLLCRGRGAVLGDTPVIVLPGGSRSGTGHS